MVFLRFWIPVVKASATQNVDGEQVGVLNKVFGGFYEIHLAGQRVKTGIANSTTRSNIR
jgi:hypothetical protein